MTHNTETTTARALTAGTSLAAALVVALAMTGTPAQAAEMEKCYGVAKAGKNDCQTATSSCAGTSKTDGQGDAFIAVPKGTCDKIVGGSTSPKM
ncbi:DUF2282 domain-containing protein [Roseospirillum parvum]|uniref:Uncharacterized membrane protein n=1 Tax=Roseospirillum parvum TaxID=83401 RepID=A0A1G8DFM5_9PROT|nr:DUF2282 domain-containing protein [Roseospirillum parvum]SDH56431.1 Uncharacterized membrane protein [Roseospirillum parvum]